MCTIRATVYLGGGESTTVFVRTNGESIDLTKEYEGFCIYSCRTITVLGSDLVNPEVIFKD